MGLNKLVKNTFSNSTSLFLRVVISYLMTPFLINGLGKDLYGVWMILVTFTLTGSLSFFTFGFQGALVKYIAEFHALKKQRELNEVFSATFLFYCVGALLCSAVILVFSRFYLADVFNIPIAELPTAQMVLYIFAVMILFELPGLAICAIIEGVQRFDILAILDIGRMIVLAGVTLGVLYCGQGLVSIALAMFFSTIIYTIVMGFAAKQLVPECRIVIGGDKATLRALFLFTRDLFILRINGLIYNNMDKMIIGILLSTTLVTDYDIANRIHSLALTIMGLAPSVVLPAASAFDAANDSERQTKLLLKGSKYTIAMTLPIVVTLLILTKGLIRYWISPQYIHVALYARLFLLYMLFWPIIQVGWNMLVGVNKVKSIVPLQTISICANLIISIILVRYIGVAGTMIGTVVANFMIFFAYLRLISNTFQVSITTFLRSVVVPTYLLGGVIALSLYTITAYRLPESLLQVCLYGVVSVVAYYIAYFVFCIDKVEKIRFTEMYYDLQNKISQTLTRRA